MTLNDLQNTLSNIKKGKFATIHYQKVNGDYLKETEKTIRFVAYENIKGVQVKNKANANDNYVSDFIIYNSNTQKYYLMVATTNTPYKAQVKYYKNGVEITKEEYEMENKPRKSYGPSPVFKLHIEDIISITQNSKATE